MATEESQGEDYVIRYQKKWKDMALLHSTLALLNPLYRPTYL